jgi:hypothetical protein
MQLRVARLCLDCEEVFEGENCPVCASDRYAFLTSWLPVEDRRRWRRPGPKPASTGQGMISSVRRFYSRWFGESDPAEARRGLRTRASDRMPDMTFEDPAKKPKKQPARAQEPIKGDVR